MNRLYTTILAATALTFSAAAQQIPNSGFDTWEDCIPWSPSNTTNKQGTTPTPWTVSNVWNSTSLARTTIASEITGYKDKAVKLENAYKYGQVIPGYMTLGKPWSTATGFGSNKDGGTWGGYDFAFRPDAITFMYQSSGSEQPTAIIYSWKGAYQQADVPASIAISGEPALCTMINRDRNILGISTSKGGAVTCVGDTALISYLNTRLEAAATSWTKATLDIPYKTKDTPEKINVIFSADNYFSTSPVKDNTISLDDFAFIYYSRLKSLKVNGTDVAGFEPNKYEYTVEAAVPEDALAISTECLGNSGSGKAEVVLDKANNKATITVTNSNIGGTDVDGETSHVYTVNFKAAEIEDPNTKKYPGHLEIKIGTDVVPQETTVEITPNAEYTSCTFNLPDFSFLGLSFGDLRVDDVKMTHVNGVTSFDGQVKNMTLHNEDIGDISADVNVKGTCDAEGNLVMTIDVIWHDDQEDTPIYVTFNGKGDPIKTSAIGGIEVDDENAPVEYYNIQGVKVNGDNLAPGFYIVRQGKKVSKIFVK